MKKSLLLILIISGAIVAKEVKIGFVDSKRIFSEYQATAAASAQFNEYVKACQDSASILRQNIEKLQSELEAQKLVLSEEARLKKLDEIDELTRSYNNYLQEVFGSGGKIEQKNDELMAPLVKKINDAVAKIAEQEGFKIVLDLSEGIYYASSELDITDMVIDQLNLEYGPATLPTGEVKKTIAIFPFREDNTEAQDADLGERIWNELYSAINIFRTKYNIIAKNMISIEIRKQGLTRNIADEQAYKIGHNLICDYIIIGNVTKSASKISYTISIRDVSKEEIVAQRKSTVTEEIKLSESLNNDLRALLAKIE